MTPYDGVGVSNRADGRPLTDRREAVYNANPTRNTGFLARRRVWAGGALFSENVGVDIGIRAHADHLTFRLQDSPDGGGPRLVTSSNPDFDPDFANAGLPARTLSVAYTAE